MDDDGITKKVSIVFQIKTPCAPYPQILATPLLKTLPVNVLDFLMHKDNNLFNNNYDTYDTCQVRRRHVLSCTGLQLELAAPRNRSHPDVGGWKQSDA